MSKILQSIKIPVFLALFIIFGWFLFTYRIIEVPPGINGDETAIGLNAVLVSKTGYDSSGRYLPLFAAVKDSKDWKQPVTFYSEVIAFKIFGPSYFTLRAVSVVFALLSGILIFLLIYELTSFKTAVFGVLLFITTPIVMIQSHLALENIAPVPFITFWLWMLVKYSKTLKIKYLLLGGIALAVSVYSYLGLRLIMPPLTLLTVFFVYYLNRKNPKLAVKKIFIFILAVIPILLILPLVKEEYPGSFLGQYRPYKISSYQELIMPYISSFDPSFLFLKGDSTPYHSTGKQGVFLLASAPLFLAGTIAILRQNQPILIFILISFFITPVLFGLGSDIHRGSRLLSLIPAYVVVTALGIASFLNLKRKVWRFISISLILMLIILNFKDFLTDYWYDYPGRAKEHFSKPYHLAFETAKGLATSRNLTPFIQKDFRDQNSFAEDFFENIYFPDKLKTWGDDEPLPVKSTIIVPYYLLLRYKNLEQMKFGDGEFGLIINP